MVASRSQRYYEQTAVTGPGLALIVSVSLRAWLGAVGCRPGGGLQALAGHLVSRRQKGSRT